MPVVLSEETLRAADLTAGELRQELAILLFRQDELTLIQAAKLAAMAPLPFQHLLASRGIGPHYEVADFAQDLETLTRLGRA
jgi:predicted HTH domain antitoxin